MATDMVGAVECPAVRLWLGFEPNALMLPPTHAADPAGHDFRAAWERDHYAHYEIWLNKRTAWIAKLEKAQRLEIQRRRNELTVAADAPPRRASLLLGGGGADTANGAGSGGALGPALAPAPALVPAPAPSPSPAPLTDAADVAKAGARGSDNKEGQGSEAEEARGLPSVLSLVRLRRTVVRMRQVRYIDPYQPPISLLCSSSHSLRRTVVRMRPLYSPICSPIYSPLCSSLYSPI